MPLQSFRDPLPKNDDIARPRSAPTLYRRKVSSNHQNIENNPDRNILRRWASPSLYDFVNGRTAVESVGDGRSSSSSSSQAANNRLGGLRIQGDPLVQLGGKGSGIGVQSRTLRKNYARSVECPFALDY